MRDYKNTLDALEYWAENKQVCVDSNNHELSWRDDRSKGKWKDLWEIQAFYTYDCVVGLDLDKEVDTFNFDADYYPNLGSLVIDMWFRKAEKLGFRRDNKTAIKLHNILTNQVVYMGWYDMRLRVSAIEPHKFECCRVHEVKN